MSERPCRKDLLDHINAVSFAVDVTDKNWAAKLLPENIPPDCCITKK